MMDVQATFSVNPSSLENAKGRAVPNFLIEGKLHNVNCSITKPFTGEVPLAPPLPAADRHCQVKVTKSDVPIKSIELQLVRVETCGLHFAFIWHS